MLSNGSYDRVLPLVVDGNPVWAYWHYEADEWQYFITHDTARLRGRYTWYCLLIVIAGMAVGAWLGSANSSGTDWLSKLFYFLLPGATGAGIAGLIYLFFISTEEKWRRELAAKPPEVVITPLHVRIGDKVIPIVSRGLNLRGVSVRHADKTRPEGMQLLCFRVKAILSRSTGYDIYVPIPRQRSAEAQEVIGRFRTLLPWQGEEAP